MGAQHTHAEGDIAPKGVIKVALWSFFVNKQVMFTFNETCASLKNSNSSQGTF